MRSFCVLGSCLRLAAGDMALGMGAMCPNVNASLTCGLCPNCINATCADEAIPLPQKSDFWPPHDILQKQAGPDPIPPNFEAELEWFQATVLDVLPSSVKQSDTKYDLSEREETLVKMSLSEWIEARAASLYTCEDLAKALTKRAMYLQDIQKMNHFMYWNDRMFSGDEVAVGRASTSYSGYNWIQVVMAQAIGLDAKAEKEGVDAIAPLYCYPIPLKGTILTKHFPSSAGFAVLHDRFGLVDAALVTLIENAGGVQFGKTNVPEFAHSPATGNYANGLTFSPWGYDSMAGGSSGGSAAAVAAYTATIAVTEDTFGSTNLPAARNHLFGYDPPKFHYPNEGNPSITIRNDQLGVNARSMDDIIAFDKAVLGTDEAHAAAKAYVDRLDNSDITIGCSHVYYNYTVGTDAIRNHYDKVVNVLASAGFSFAEECQVTLPTGDVPLDVDMAVASSGWFSELYAFLKNGLGLPGLNPWDVMLNAVYDFGRTKSTSWMYGFMNAGCAIIGLKSENNTAAYLGPVPALRSDAYNEYFDTFNVDLVMGPSQYCDKVLWSEDIKGSCDQGILPGSCAFMCHALGIFGLADKTFTKAKFVVPVNLTEVGEPLTIQFMSRAGPRNPTVPAMEWVHDEEGPKEWNLEELYMVKRIADVLAEAGLGRADAPFNEMTGLKLSALYGTSDVRCRSSTCDTGGERNLKGLRPS